MARTKNVKRPRPEVASSSRPPTERTSQGARIGADDDGDDDGGDDGADDGGDDGGVEVGGAQDGGAEDGSVEVEEVVCSEKEDEGNAVSTDLALVPWFPPDPLVTLSPPATIVSDEVFFAAMARKEKGKEKEKAKETKKSPRPRREKKQSIHVKTPYKKGKMK